MPSIRRQISNLFSRKPKEVLSRNAIQAHRAWLSKQLNEHFDSTVKYGPFKGLKLVNDTWWGATDRASMLLGLYEQEVLISLMDIPEKYTVFIDIGAADGYYGIGVLVNRLFQKSYCFEVSDKGREIIQQNVILNRVQDKVIVEGCADSGFYRKIANEDIESSVLLIDIEGGEFDLLSKDVFNVFRNSIFFIELHDWFFQDGDARLAKLKMDAQSTHSITEFKMSSRDLSEFPELRTWSDTDRWLICSEGRLQLMTWLRLDPIHVKV